MTLVSIRKYLGYLIIFDFLLQLSYSSSFVFQLLVKNADIHDDGRCNGLMTNTTADKQISDFLSVICFAPANTVASQIRIILFLVYFHSPHSSGKLLQVEIWL